MSVVVRMEMPKNCCECQLRQYDTEEEFCPFTGVECLSIGRQDNCPILCSLPEGHGRLVDISPLDVISFSNENDSFCAGALSVCERIDELPTIVPAEAERSET